MGNIRRILILIIIVLFLVANGTPSISRHINDFDKKVFQIDSNEIIEIKTNYHENILIQSIKDRLLTINGWEEKDKIFSSDGLGGDQFGYSVSIDGNYAIIGAPYADVNGDDSGSAYIFTRTGKSWSQQAKLIPSDGEKGDWFGWSVSINEDYIIIGSILDDSVNGIDSGSAYIFKRSGATWSQQAKLIPSDGAEGDFFGQSVSINGDYAVIGAYHNDDNGLASGSAYIFNRLGNNWFQQAKLLPSDGTFGKWFGYSVSINKDHTIIGAPFDEENGRMSGSAYIFNRLGNNWFQQAKLLPSDGAKYDEFGFSVSINGDYAIIGAYLNDDNGDASGSAYIFTCLGATWSQQAKLIPSDGAEGDLFGLSVSINGEFAIIGAKDEINGNDSGSAYIFTRSGATWSQQAKLIPSDGAEGDWFGWSVSIDGQYVIIGAYGDDLNGEYSGSAYIFKKSGENHPILCFLQQHPNLFPILRQLLLKL